VNASRDSSEIESPACEQVPNTPSIVEQINGGKQVRPLFLFIAASGTGNLSLLCFGCQLQGYHQ
jgi:hypothetical protein